MIQLTRPSDFAFACPQASRLVGDGPIYHCSLCDEPVVDLSSISAEDAERVMATMGGRSFCARVAVAGGRVVHRPKRSALRTVSLALGLGFGGVALAHWAFSSPPPAAKPAGGAVGITGESGPSSLRSTVEAAIRDAERMAEAPPSAAPRTDIEVISRIEPAEAPRDQAPASVDAVPIPSSDLKPTLKDLHEMRDVTAPGEIMLGGVIVHPTDSDG